MILFYRYATMNIDPRDLLEPGPIDPSVLYLQSAHRSDAIWAREEWHTSNTLRTRISDSELRRNRRPIVLPELRRNRRPFLDQSTTSRKLRKIIFKITFRPTMLLTEWYSSRFMISVRNGIM